MTGVSEFASRANEYEKDVLLALIRRAGVLDVRLRLHIEGPGRADVETAARRLFDTQAKFGAASPALRDALETTVDAYARDLSEAAQARLGEKVEGFRSLSPLERDAILAFLSWAVYQSFEGTRSGQRLADLDLAAAEFGG